MYTQQVLSALAVVGFAAAQSTGLCNQATATINSQADATQYASCSTIDGDVLIGEGATQINLDGPQQITGSLIAHNAKNLITLASTTVNSIATMDLFNLTTMSTLSFGSLTSVANISWNALPALSALTFPSTITSSKTVVIQNTFLSSLDGINLATADTLEIFNNNQLTTFSTQIANVSSSINIANNGKTLNVQFPNLIWASSLTVRNVSSLMVPSLTVVNNSFGLYENYFDSVNAPNLTTVGSFANKVGSFAMVANPALTNFSVPVLTSVGGAVQVENNTALTSISLPKLQTVGGAIDLLGNFSTFSLPSITNVQGGAVIESTNDIDSLCSSFTSSAGNALQGKSTCTGQVADPTGTGIPTGTGTSTGSTSSSTSKKNAAGRFGVEETVAGLSVAGALLQMLL